MTDLIEFVDNVCGGNIRLALDFIQVFVGSGHPDTSKMLEIYRQTRQYVVALHEFLRAVIYGGYRDYEPNFSEIANLFDIGGIDGREHFLAPIVLAYLGLESRASGNNGYVETESVYGYSQNIGFQPAQIRNVLSELIRRKLIETETRQPLAGPAGSTYLYFRITTIGSYYYQKLVNTFTYIDAMVLDTPIVDRALREQTRDANNILSRLERAETFTQYLDSQWTSIEIAADVFDWNSLSTQLRDEITWIRERVERSIRRNQVNG